MWGFSTFAPKDGAIDFDSVFQRCGLDSQLLLCLLPPGSRRLRPLFRDHHPSHSLTASKSAFKKEYVFSLQPLRKIKILERENRGVNMECAGLTLSVSLASFSSSFSGFSLHFQKVEKQLLIFSKRSPTQFWRLCFRFNEPLRDQG